MAPATLIQTQEQIQSLFNFDPKRDKPCRGEKDESKYGFIADLERSTISPAGVEPKKCYQQNFYDQATAHLSRSLQDLKFDPAGSSKTLRIGHCDLEINYHGTDAKTYNNTDGRFHYVSYTLTQRKAYGARYDHVVDYHQSSDNPHPYTGEEFVSTSDQKRFFNPAAMTTSKSLFQETFQQNFDDYSSVSRAKKANPFNKGAGLLEEMIPSSYIWCSDNG